MIKQWHRTDVDSGFYLLLQDLTSVLMKQKAFQFVYSHGAVVDLINQEVSGSSFWDVPWPDMKKAGYTTDVLLRTMGTMQQSDIPALQAYFKELEQTSLPKFAAQLVTCLEDVRLEALIQQRRPGTKKDFSTRLEAMKHHFHTQLKANKVRSLSLDELFCLIYLQLYAEDPDPNFKEASPNQKLQLEKLRPQLFDVFSCTNTEEIVQVAKRIVYTLENNYTDMLHDYFTFPIKHLSHFTERTLFDELTRTDPLANDDTEKVNQEDQEVFDQPFSTWHRENENSDRKQNFLQFELDVGTKTEILGGGARETEEGDQALANIQGDSQQSEQNDFSETGALQKQESKGSESAGGALYGRENKYAVAKIKEASTPTETEKEAYRKTVETIDPYRRKLANTIEKTLEHKRNAPHKNLLFGRLSKNLLPLVVDNNPRVFYKKAFESKEVDAAFTLLVDCSASMDSKMEETKRGIVLFHEVLEQLRIPHSIVGFWEDTTRGTETHHPNYFHEVHRFQDSLHSNTGATIMQLEAEEDNRDGFSIRLAAEKLLKRREKNKFLLVFSDGEPAAMNYNQNGIVDTNVAVAEARKKGLEVVGMFLADGEIGEQDEALMQNIYGKSHVMVPDIAELPELFIPVLKQLLLRGI